MKKNITHISEKKHICWGKKDIFMEKTINELFDEAKNVSKNSYSPYSKFPVGACALFENGKKYYGVNVENVSYGLTLCAERNALSNAITQGETSGLVAIAIYSPKQKCACRAALVFNGWRNSDARIKTLPLFLKMMTAWL